MIEHMQTLVEESQTQEPKRIIMLSSMEQKELAKHP